jgi:hypothetical protein
MRHYPCLSVGSPGSRLKKWEFYYSLERAMIKLRHRRPSPSARPTQRASNGLRGTGVTVTFWLDDTRYICSDKIRNEKINNMLLMDFSPIIGLVSLSVWRSSFVHLLQPWNLVFFFEFQQNPHKNTNWNIADDLACVTYHDTTTITELGLWVRLGLYRPQQKKNRKKQKTNRKWNIRIDLSVFCWFLEDKADRNDWCDGWWWGGGAKRGIIPLNSDGRGNAWQRIRRFVIGWGLLFFCKSV